MIEELPSVVLIIGSAGENDRLLAGVIVFGLVGLLSSYFIFFREDMEIGLTVKVLTVIMFLLMIVSYIWPNRPWPH